MYSRINNALTRWLSSAIIQSITDSWSSNKSFAISELCNHSLSAHTNTHTHWWHKLDCRWISTRWRADCLLGSTTDNNYCARTKALFWLANGQSIGLNGQHWYESSTTVVQSIGSDCSGNQDLINIYHPVKFELNRLCIFKDMLAHKNDQSDSSYSHFDAP